MPLTLNAIPPLLVHLVLAGVLFFAVNWIGRHSLSVGYVQLSLFGMANEAPAFNVLFRVLAPVAYVVLCSAAAYAGGLDRFVPSIWLVPVYYVGLRWLVVIALGRARLVNWVNQLAVAAVTIAITRYIYDHVLLSRASVLPKLNTLTDELWLGIIVFVYQTANRVRTSDAGPLRRRREYIGREFRRFSLRYGRTVQSIAPNVHVELFVYAIIIYESFNRPALARSVERIAQRFGRAKTTGVMQVRADKALTDAESVQRGTEMIVAAYERELLAAARRVGAVSDSESGVRPSGPLPTFLIEVALLNAAAKYNVRSDYPKEVAGVYHTLLALEHPKLPDAFYTGLLDRIRVAVDESNRERDDDLG